MITIMTSLLLCCFQVSPLRVMSYDLNLRPHIILAQARHADTSQMGLWCGIQLAKFRTIASSASLLGGRWYEFTRKTCDPPLHLASLKLSSTLAKAWSTRALISL